MPSNLEQPPYKVYRSGPRGLKGLLRGEDADLIPPSGPGDGYRKYKSGRDGRRWFRGRLTWKRALLYLAVAIVAWLALSLVLFVISASVEQGNLPASRSSALLRS